MFAGLSRGFLVPRTGRNKPSCNSPQSNLPRLAQTQRSTSLGIVIASMCTTGPEVLSLLCAARGVRLSDETQQHYYIQWVTNPARAAEEEAWGEYTLGTPATSDASFQSSSGEDEPIGELSVIDLRRRSDSEFRRWWEYKRTKLRARSGNPTAEPFTGEFSLPFRHPRWEGAASSHTWESVREFYSDARVFPGPA